MFLVRHINQKQQSSVEITLSVISVKIMKVIDIIALETEISLELFAKHTFY